MAPWDLERPTQKVWILLVVDILTQYCLKTCKRTVRKVSDVIEILDWMNRVLYISGLVRCKEDFTFLHIIHSSLKQSKKWSSAYAPGPCHVQVIVSWKKTKKKGGKTHIAVRQSVKKISRKQKQLVFVDVFQIKTHTVTHSCTSFNTSCNSLLQWRKGTFFFKYIYMLIHLYTNVWLGLQKRHSTTKQNLASVILTTCLSRIFPFPK